MRILFQLRIVIISVLLGIVAGCGPAPKPHEAGTEPAPDPTDTETEGFQGVLKLSPWPTLLVMEAGDNGELSEVPMGLVTRDWQALELSVDLRKLNDKLVELQGTPVFSGPARVIQVAPGTMVELEGSFGTPGRAAESRPVGLTPRWVTGRVFSLAFLARNGPKLPTADDQQAVQTQLQELRAGLPMVLLLDLESRRPELKSVLILLADGLGNATAPESLENAVNQQVRLQGTPEVQGAWQVLLTGKGEVPDPPPSPLNPTP